MKGKEMKFEVGPIYETLGPEDEDGMIAFRRISTGRISVGLAEHIRLANAVNGMTEPRPPVTCAPRDTP